jgi:hypothetical protein
MQVTRGYDAQTGGTNRNSTTKAGQDSNENNEQNVSNNGAADSVDIDTAMLAWRLADENHDGVVDRREMANAAYQLLSKENATAEEKALGNMFATIVLGGADGKGLDPYDSNISESDMRSLARADGNGDSISAKDFKVTMGDRAAGGNPFTLDELYQIAHQQNAGAPGAPAPGTPAPAPAPGTPAPAPTPGYGSPAPAPAPAPGNQPQQPANDQNAFISQMIQMMIQLLTQLLQMMGGGGQRTSA